MALSVFISTPEIAGFDEVQLHDRVNYQIVRPLGPGAVIKRNTYAEADYMHGGLLLKSIKENPVLPLTVLCKGFSHANLASNMSLLMRCLDQHRFRIGVTWNDVEWEWYCHSANYDTGSGDGEIDADLWRIRMQVVRAQVIREPIPIKGTH